MPIYAIFDHYEGHPRYLTPGKRYETRADPDSGNCFTLTDDAGDEILCCWNGCAHLDGHDWIRHEEPDTETDPGERGADATIAGRFMNVQFGEGSMVDWSKIVAEASKPTPQPRKWRVVDMPNGWAVYYTDETGAERPFGIYTDSAEMFQDVFEGMREDRGFTIVEDMA